MDLLKNLTVLSLEQATVLPYLTYRLAHDGVQVIRLEHPIYGERLGYTEDALTRMQKRNII